MNKIAMMATLAISMALSACGGPDFQAYDRLSAALAKKDDLTVREIVNFESVRQGVTELIANQMRKNYPAEMSNIPGASAFETMIQMQSEAQAKKLASAQTFIQLFNAKGGKEMLANHVKEKKSSNRFDVKAADPSNPEKYFIFVFQKDEAGAWRVTDFTPSLINE